MQIEKENARLVIEESGSLSWCLEGSPAWSTTGPLLILHYYDRQHPRAQIALISSTSGSAFGTAGTPSMNAKGELKLHALEDGRIRLAAEFKNVGIKLEVYFELEEKGAGFDVTIPADGIEESMSHLYRILGVEVLPEFGAAKTGEKGYLTLPNWSGCQTFFDKSYPREVWQTVYSSNDEWENVSNMPVFGITRAHGTLCGLIARGDFDARLVCRVHWEHEHRNSVHPYLIYRWQQQDEAVPGPREIRYRIAPPDYAGGEGYVLCGKTYRDFLYAERGLLSWKDKAVRRPVVLEYRDRFCLKIFMAYKEPQADGRGTYHATCTFAEAREILEECQRRGMRRLLAVLVGWGQDGHDGMPPTRFPVDERLGGEKEMKRLIAWCADHDIMLGVHDSYGGYYTCSPEFNTDDLTRHRTGEYWESIIWSGGQAHLVCPKIFVEKQVKRDIPAIRKLGIYGHHHIDAVGSFMPCYSPEHPLDQRIDFVNEVRKMFEIAIEQIGSVSTEYPFGPYFDVIDGFYHTYSYPSPWHRASPIGRFFLDRTIPLVQIALHGSVNCGESIGKVKDPLHWLDVGLVPQWEVCKTPASTFGISSFASAVERLLQIYELYYGSDHLLERINPLFIEGRWEREEGVSETLYSDGTLVRVNRLNKPYEGLAANSYSVTANKARRECGP
jgi:hypothetical protein